MQITATEAVGVEGRGACHDPAGVVRDMFQNHLLQLVDRELFAHALAAPA